LLRQPDDAPVHGNADVQTELRPIALRAHCPVKGGASYWTIETEAGTHVGHHPGELTLRVGRGLVPGTPA
jgi:hypothetical protein